MKSVKNIVIFSTILVTSIGIYFYYTINKSSEQNLTTFKTAQQEFNQDQDTIKLERYKQQLEHYYTSGAYEQEVARVCKDAEHYFDKVPIRINSIIIFDVDDTAVYNYHRMDKFDFIWSKQPQLVQRRAVEDAPAIKPVLELYRFLRARGFEIIFLTSRNAGQYDETYQELVKAGYTNFKELILMPDKLAFDPTIKTADWKLQARKELARKYSIVGCVGDRDADFEGGYTGYRVKLPNYLY